MRGHGRERSLVLHVSRNLPPSSRASSSSTKGSSLPSLDPTESVMHLLPAKCFSWGWLDCFRSNLRRPSYCNGRKGDDQLGMDSYPGTTPSTFPIFLHGHSLYRRHPGEVGRTLKPLCMLKEEAVEPVGNGRSCRFEAEPMEAVHPLLPSLPWMDGSASKDDILSVKLAWGFVCFMVPLDGLRATSPAIHDGSAWWFE